MNDAIRIDGYTFFASFHEAARDLNDSQYGKLTRMINEYAFYGNEPSGAIPRPLKMAFVLIKPQIDASRRKRAEYLTDVDNGKKGGAPKGNKNAKKQAKTTPKTTPETTPETTPKTTPETTINSIKNSSYKLNGSGNPKKQPPPFFLTIKNKITEAGYFLDDDQSLERLIDETDPSWFQENSFIDFIIEIVREQYGGKPKRERRDIFRKLLFDAANLREEYPEWKRQKEAEAEARARKEAVDKAEADKPRTCPKCGKALDSRLRCPDGHGRYEFDKTARRYCFEESGPVDFSELSRMLWGKGIGPPGKPSASPALPP